MVSLVPTTLQRLLDAGLREPPALRWALVGGAPVTPALVGRAAAHAVPVATTYGLTESCSQVTTLGAPLFCTGVRLAEGGEILVSGPTVGPAAAPVHTTADLRRGCRVPQGPPGRVERRRDPARGRAQVGHDRDRRRERRADRGRGGPG